MRTFPARRLEDVSWKTPLKKVVATSILDQSRTSLRPKLRRFQDVFATSLCRLGIGGWKYLMFWNDKFLDYSNISKNMILIQTKCCRNVSSIQIDLSRKKLFSTQEAINNIPSTAKRKKVALCKMFPLGSLGLLGLSSSILPVLSWQLKIIAYRGMFTVPTSSKLELFSQYVMTSWRYIVTRNLIIDDVGVWDLPLVFLFSGQRISKKIKIKQSQHLHVQKEDQWNKVWNFHSPNPSFPRRNQLSLLCNIELGDKGGSGNIKIDFLVLH